LPAAFSSAIVAIVSMKSTENSLITLLFSLEPDAGARRYWMLVPRTWSGFEFRQPLCDKHFEQRLARYVALVGEELEISAKKSPYHHDR